MDKIHHRQRKRYLPRLNLLGRFRYYLLLVFGLSFLIPSSLPPPPPPPPPLLFILLMSLLKDEKATPLPSNVKEEDIPSATVGQMYELCARGPAMRQVISRGFFFLSYFFFSFPFLSFSFLSFPFLSFPFLSFPFLSFPFLSSKFICLQFYNPKTSRALECGLKMLSHNILLSVFIGVVSANSSFGAVNR